MGNMLTTNLFNFVTIFDYSVYILTHYIFLHCNTLLIEYSLMKQNIIIITPEHIRGRVVAHIVADPQSAPENLDGQVLSLVAQIHQHSVAVVRPVEKKGKVGSLPSHQLL